MILKKAASVIITVIFLTAFKGVNGPAVVNAKSMQACIKKLQAAYPDKITAVADNAIIWYDGSKMVFDDGKRNKSFNALLDSADLEDQVCAMSYSRDDFSAPKKFNDPGRIRYEPFFRKMYGNSEQEVKANLVEITWLPKSVHQKIRVSK